MKPIAGVCAALAISTVGLVGSTAAGAVQDQRAQEITTVGCVRAWKPATADVTKMPDNREPGMSGMFLLTPLASGPTTSFEVPTYLLTPSATANYQQHLDRKVQIVGVPETAPPPTTVRVIVTTSSQLSENRADVQAFPRLTVRSITRVADSCPS